MNYPNKNIKGHHHEDRRGRCCGCRTRNWSFLVIGLSCVLIGVLGVTKYFALEWMVDKQIAQQLQLVPGSDTFKQWEEVTLPIIMRFWLFNVTNPAEVQNGGKPRLREVGPFAYEEKRVKDIISTDPEKDTIHYRQRIYYHFRPDLSNGSESDRFVVINVPFVTLSKLTYDNVGNFSFAHALADRSMRQRGERLFTYATVKEYLFDGYSVQHYINFLSSPALQLIGGVKIPDSIKTGKFGFYLGKNGTDDGDYVVRSGKTNPQEIGQIVSWNGKTRLDHYSGGCNLINGTDGSLVPPFLTKESRIRFFSSDICRSIYTLFHEESEVRGIPTYRFIPPDPKKVFNNQGFCFCPTGKNNECFKQGVLSMAPCRGGAPIAMSPPHFLNSDIEYQNAVEGLSPNDTVHETFIDVEPKTGLILKARKRLQFNVMVKHNRNMLTFGQIRPATMFPFMWVEESVETTDAVVNQLQSTLFAPVKMAQTVTSGGLISSLILLFVGLLSLLFTRNRAQTTSTWSVTSDNSTSFHGDNRGISPSPGGSLRSMTPPKEPSIRSARSFSISRGTMTISNESKGTMTETDQDNPNPNDDDDSAIRRISNILEGTLNPSYIPEEEDNKASLRNSNNSTVYITQD